MVALPGCIPTGIGMHRRVICLRISLSENRIPLFRDMHCTPRACWPGVSEISRRRKDGRSQRLPLANNLPANNAADESLAVHGAHNGRGRPWRQEFGPAVAPQFRSSASGFRGGSVCCAREKAGEILRTTAGVGLHWRARHGAVRTEHAAVARAWLQPFATSFAVIKELARFRWHGFRGAMSAPRTGQCRFRNHVWHSVYSRAAKCVTQHSTTRSGGGRHPFLPKCPALAVFGALWLFFCRACLESTTLPGDALRSGKLTQCFHVAEILQQLGPSNL